MGRRSPKLKDKGEAVVALLKYIKQQSNKTLLELERQFTPRTVNSGKEGEDDNHGGRQWSRWLLGNAQPEIKIVTNLYNFACDKLIQGEWAENGNEEQWAQLLPVFMEPNLAFIANKKLTLIEILKQLENPVATRMVRGIKAGYYLPSADDIQEIFWSKPIEQADADTENVSWHRIWSSNDVEKAEMELLLTDILVRFGLPEQDRTKLEEFANECGLAGRDIGSWTDQIHHQMQLDTKSLSEILFRVRYLYPNEFKWSDDFDDESIIAAKKKHFKLLEYLATADNKFNDYSEAINLASKTSIIFGLFSKLSREHAMSNGFKNRIGWNYPVIEIL